jgi:glycosyltransferase involved in cell wall biosynthesis
MVVIGGAEKMILAALGFFRKRGAKVHCVLNEWENHRIARAVEDLGITWSTGLYRRPMLKRTQSVRERLNGILGMLVTSGDLIGDYVRNPAPLIFAPDFSAVVRNAPALGILTLLGVKLVLYMQNAPPSGQFYARLFRRAIDPLVDRYVVTSLDSAAALTSFGISSEKVDRVANFAPERDAPAAPPAKIPGRVAFVAQIIPQKGLDLLLDAVAIVAERGIDVSLDVAGRIEGWIDPAYAAYRDDLLKRAARADLVDRVTFLGERDDVPAILMRATVHCAPSRPEMHEGMPLVCIEAKRAGTPSVVTPVGPFSELVEHGVDGWIARDVTAEGIAEGLVHFLSNAKAAQSAGEAARASGERYSRERFEEEWERVMLTVAPRRGWPRG